MDEIEIKKIAAEIADDVDLSGLFAEDGSNEDQVNLWIPTDYKRRFAAHQRRSKKKFGKIAKAVLMRLIDRADQDAS